MPRIFLKELIWLFSLISVTIKATGTGSKPSLSFEDNKLVRDVEHLKRELSGIIEVAVENISYEHMEFYFFGLHDLNKDKNLDGNELYAALTETSIKLLKGFEDYTNHDVEAYFMDAVDALLQDTDTNDDGLISWKEYLSKTRSFLDM